MQINPNNIPAVTVGTRVVCPLRHPVGTVAKPIPAGTKLLSGYLDYAPGQERLAGDSDICHVCGHSYVNGRGRLLAVDGWISVQHGAEDRHDGRAPAAGRPAGVTARSRRGGRKGR